VSPASTEIDFNEYPIEKDKLFFIQPGQIHQLAAENKPRGYVIIFSPDFLNKSKIDKTFIDGLKVFNSFLYNEPLPITREKAEKLQKIIKSISESLSSASRYRDEMLGAYLKIFLIECTSVCDAKIEIG
jgi:AraC family transcriptional activator of pobA